MAAEWLGTYESRMTASEVNQQKQCREVADWLGKVADSLRLDEEVREIMTKEGFDKMKPNIYKETFKKIKQLTIEIKAKKKTVK